MNPETKKQMIEAFQALLAWLEVTFDKIANWVTALSWKRLIAYTIVALIIGGILQDNLFSDDSDAQITIKASKKSRAEEKEIKRKLRDLEKAKEAAKETEEDANDTEDSADAEVTPPVPPAPALPPAPANAANASTPVSPPTPPTAPTAPTAPGTAPPPVAVNAMTADMQALLNNMKEAQNESRKAAKQAREAVRAAKQAAIEAKDAAALATTSGQEQVVHYRKQSSRWFMNFVLLAVIGLFATKALMGGKKRAEAQTEQAKADAEREALQRQVSEAQMQMMQAQVEPHFLFNTLASVEYLIETDPPRAAKMQRSLIKYLRGVLPQMRENALLINLGREVDIVRDYLELLKMRMEERLQVEIDVPDTLRNAAFPPMMLQSLTENAIKHGLECKAEGGKLLIRARAVEGMLRVSVLDDGMGFGAVKSDSTGLGLHSIRERLKLLHGNKAQLTIEPNHPSGVCATIEVPYEVARGK